MSVIIKLNGVEAAVVTPGSGPTVINVHLPGPDQSVLRIGLVMAGLVCLSFCWTSPYLYTGLWSGIPFILTAFFFIVHESTSHPSLLVAALLMNFLSCVLAVAGICMFNYRWRSSTLEYFVVIANFAGIYCCLRSFSWPGGFPLKKVVQGAKSLLDPEPPPYTEKSPDLDKV